MKALAIYLSKEAHMQMLDQDDIKKIRDLDVTVEISVDPQATVTAYPDWEYSGDLELDFDLADRVTRLLDHATERIWKESGPAL